MEDNLFFIIIGSFLGGWIFKAISYRFLVYNQTGEFVRAMAKQSLSLIGSAVYKVSLIDQLCVTMMGKLDDVERAKVLKNELENNFVDWKDQAIQDFIDSYPQQYRWQVEFTDWKGAMEELTSIYNKGER